MYVYVCMTLHARMYVRGYVRACVFMYVSCMYNICMIYLTSVFSQQSNVGPMII